MKVLILTPEKTIYEGETITLRVPIIDGSFQFLENHTSIIFLLKKGNVFLYLKYHYFIINVNNGILNIKNNIVKILVD